MGIAALVPGSFTPTYLGTASTFRTPGRAGTAGQKIFALFNAAGSLNLVFVNHLSVDLYQTVIKAVTVAPPIVRVRKITALPTQGTALTKVSRDSSLVANASVTVHGDASADGVIAAQALASTPAANTTLGQAFAPRLITGAGYEPCDRVVLFEGSLVRLGPVEGFVVELVYTAAAQNPVTDMWMVTADWDETQA